jgi:hypothetical protein
MRSQPKGNGHPDVTGSLRETLTLTRLGVTGLDHQIAPRHGDLIGPLGWVAATNPFGGGPDGPDPSR